MPSFKLSVTQKEIAEHYERRKNKKARSAAKLRDSVLKQKYGTTGALVDELFEKQRGVCAICSNRDESRPLVVDHDHRNKTHIRGLLCRACNSGLGAFRDSADILRAAIDYLDKQRNYG